MSFDRLMNFTVIVIGVFLLLFGTFVGATMLDPVRDTVQDHDPQVGDLNADKAMADIYRAVVLWIPLIGGAGLIILGLFREYQRQRTANLRRVR